MTSSPVSDESASERAELLVQRLEQDVGRVARLALARAVELAEDLWAEARTVRDQGRDDR